MANLHGILEVEVELNLQTTNSSSFGGAKPTNCPPSPPKTFKESKLMKVTGISMELSKIWNYTVDGKSGVFKEKVEFDDNNMPVTLHGIEGHIYDEYKVYRLVCKVVPKEQGSVAKLSIEYEKYKASDPNPDKYMAVFIEMTKDIDAYVSSA